MSATLNGRLTATRQLNGILGAVGSGGTNDYNALLNKPAINNVTLTGNKTTAELGIIIPTKTSDLINDSGYITSMPSMIGTGTGEVVTITDGGDNIPLKDITAAVVAVQSGTGTVNPDNVRPIVGFNSCEVTVTDGTTPTVYDVSLGQTIYGGLVDLTKGTGTITHVLITYNGGESETWSKVSGTGKFYIVNTNLPDYELTGKISNIYPFSGEARGSGFVTVDKSFYTQTDTETVSYNRFWVYNSDYTNYNNAQFKEVLANEPLTILVKLVTPIPFTFTGDKIYTKSGYNQISANTGNVNVEYFNNKANEFYYLIQAAT